MNDQHHPGDHTGGVRLQSTAIVLAAFITTLGAVTAALIQTGWFGKPETVSLAPIADSPRLASFAPDTSDYFPTPIDKAAIIAPRPSAQLTGTITTPPVAQATFTGNIEPASPVPMPQQTFATARLKPNSPPHPITVPGATSLTSALTSALTSPLHKPQQNSVYYPPSAEIQTSYLQQAPITQSPSAKTSTVQTPIAQTPIAQVPPPATADAATDADVKKLNSPWTYLAQQSADGSSEAKPAKKSLDWSSVTRLFQGH